MPRYALGIDYGTSSCRSLLIDLADGSESAESVFAFPTGVAGVLTSPTDPNLARQEVSDYLEGLAATIRGSLQIAMRTLPCFTANDVVTIGIATTGSTPLPVDASGTALSLLPEFADRLAAKAWLWKDHTAHAEAAALTDTASRTRPEYLKSVGGTYSAEWFWAKIWHCARTEPDVFAAAHSWVELCDYLVGQLTGTADPLVLSRSVTAAGHKALYSPVWGGLPDADFLSSLDPQLADLRNRLYDTAQPTTDLAGTVTAEWAALTGLTEGTPVAVGSFDAHAAGVAAGVRVGTFVKVMGTSTCDVTVIDMPATGTPFIPGMCGVVPDAIIPGKISVESGQSAVGDVFNWLGDLLSSNGTPISLGRLGDDAAALAPGEHGLLALDWFNGNRSVLVDQRLTGVVLGLTLHTEPHHLFRALVEATAFGARAIIQTIEDSGSPLTTIVAGGGLPTHAPWMMQCYADVFGREITLARTSQGSALGAGIVASVAAGEFDTIEHAQDVLVHFQEKTYVPDPHAAALYNELYQEFILVHDAFGRRDGALSGVMKTLMNIRDRAVLKGNTHV